MGEGPTIGPNFLMAEFFKLAGYKGDEYMQYIMDTSEKYDVFHFTGLVFKDGLAVGGEDCQNVYDELKKVEFYRKDKFSYR